MRRKKKDEGSEIEGREKENGLERGGEIETDRQTDRDGGNEIIASSLLLSNSRKKSRDNANCRSTSRAEQIQTKLPKRSPASPALYLI